VQLSAVNHYRSQGLSQWRLRQIREREDFTITALNRIVASGILNQEGIPAPQNPHSTQYDLVFGKGRGMPKSKHKEAQTITARTKETGVRFGVPLISDSVRRGAAK